LRFLWNFGGSRTTDLIEIKQPELSICFSKLLSLLWNQLKAANSAAFLCYSQFAAAAICHHLSTNSQTSRTITIQKAMASTPLMTLPRLTVRAFIGSIISIRAGVAPVLARFGGRC
jgi:hypothetical protein